MYGPLSWYGLNLEGGLKSVWAIFLGTSSLDQDNTQMCSQSIIPVKCLNYICQEAPQDLRVLDFSEEIKIDFLL